MPCPVDSFVLCLVEELDAFVVAENDSPFWPCMTDYTERVHDLRGPLLIGLEPASERVDVRNQVSRPVQENDARGNDLVELEQYRAAVKHDDGFDPDPLEPGSAIDEPRLEDARLPLRHCERRAT